MFIILFIVLFLICVGAEAMIVWADIRAGVKGILLHTNTE